MRHGVRTLPVPLLVAAAGFTLAVAQDAPPSPTPPAPKDGAVPAEPPFTPPAILAQRRKGLKEKDANAAVAAGLDWLRRHPCEDGRWDCDGFDAACVGGKCRDVGMSVFDPGVTGLALLAFLGAGATHVEGPDAPLVAKCLQYLTDIQDSEGCFGPRTSQHFQYNHRVATMAMAEALWLTGDEKLIGPASKARDFVLKSKSQDLAWRYAVRDGDNDTSNTAYAVFALRTCEFAHLNLPEGVWTGARTWFDKMSEHEYGKVGYQQRGGSDARAWDPETSSERRSRQEPPPGQEKPPGGVGKGDRPEFEPTISRGIRTDARGDTRFGSDGGAPQSVIERYSDTAHSALTACAAAATSLTCGADAAVDVDKWAQFLSRTPPRESRAGFLDLHYMLFGSLFHAQRPIDVKPKTEDAKKTWRAWRDAVVADLVATQRLKGDGCAAGSWDPERDPFGFVGGRVYSTSMAVLALQAPNRFPKVWNPKAKPPGPAPAKK